MRTTSLVALSTILLLAACTQVTAPTLEVSGSSSSSSVVVSSQALSSAMSQSFAMQRITSSVANSSVASVSSKAAQTSSSNVPVGWNTDLTAEQINVLRDGGTEIPFTSPLLNEHRKGTFFSADCNEPVFRSEQKFDSGTGWPSFWAPITPDAVVEVTDNSLGMTRTEIRSKCGGHLGHVFNDGPQPTGLRYCMNGVALKFVPDAGQ